MQTILISDDFGSRAEHAWQRDIEDFLDIIQISNGRFRFAGHRLQDQPVICYATLIAQPVNHSAGNVLIRIFQQFIGNWQIPRVFIYRIGQAGKLWGFFLRNFATLGYFCKPCLLGTLFEGAPAAERIHRFHPYQRTQSIPAFPQLFDTGHNILRHRVAAIFFTAFIHGSCGFAFWKPLAGSLCKCFFSIYFLFLFFTRSIRHQLFLRLLHLFLQLVSFLEFVIFTHCCNRFFQLPGIPQSLSRLHLFLHLGFEFSHFLCHTASSFLR